MGKRRQKKKQKQKNVCHSTRRRRAMEVFSGTGRSCHPPRKESSFFFCCFCLVNNTFHCTNHPLFLCNCNEIVSQGVLFIGLGQQIDDKHL